MIKYQEPATTPPVVDERADKIVNNETVVVGDDVAKIEKEPLNDKVLEKVVKPTRVVGERKQEILLVLAQMLQTPQWQKITTAALASKIGFSEAALYRHYTGKAAMLSALIDFIDNSFLAMLKQIEAKSDSNQLAKIKLMAECLLVFATNNPGLTRMLTGEALLNEDEALQKRMESIYIRIEENWKILLREAILAKEITDPISIALATLLMNYIIGCWWRYSKSGFKSIPHNHFEAHWQLLSQNIK